MRMLQTKSLIIFSTLILLLASKSYAQDSIKKTGVVKIHSNEKIKKIVAKKRQYNKDLKTIDGYKIQIYFGSEKNALEKREEFKSLFPDVKTKIWLDSVDWKVWVGNYKTRLEADRALEEIKGGFISAFVVTSKIKIQ